MTDLAKPKAQPAEDPELVDWIDEDGNRHRGARNGSAYVEFVGRWLAAERTHKAELSVATEAVAALTSDVAPTNEPPSVPETAATVGESAGAEGDADKPARSAASARRK
ncbi:hypothetical protein [Gordonia sp. NB41Y]|uniref:hypothetical protein n=1 Tax=Gordonia sp. NB41Y TaxID=875808 RepID=UPI00273AD8F8|nr:hypothetical protein [Gordonia sp. NB41Y]WLP91321.1 hypothetical protein Q9K23_03355 [Gordonia sp. NB41Y]